jgi:hypothetical protein
MLHKARCDSLPPRAAIPGGEMYCIHQTNREVLPWLGWLHRTCDRSA